VITPVILCGGSGTRMWPVSRARHPKQFHRLGGDRTLLEATIQRVDAIAGAGKPIAVCNESYRFLTADQFQQCGVKDFQLILEPFGRNTAPAVTAAARWILKNDAPPLMLVMPADHVIRETAAFVKAVEEARTAALNGSLVTFGIVPTEAETGYGYIKAGDAGDGVIRKVEEFIEKPDAEHAQQYLDDGGYFWNSGMFLFDARVWINELKKFASEVQIQATRAFEKAGHNFGFVELDTECFSSCPSISIDYAVMEQTRDAVVMPLSAGWCDVGSWKGVWSVSELDAAGNATRGEVHLSQVKNSCVYSDGRLVVVNKLENVAVVDTKDVTYITPMDSSQDVKQIVAELEARGRPETEYHVRDFRPWGAFETIDRGERFQVKRLMLNPGASISLQYHHHRAEHWVIVKGTARVQKGEENLDLGMSQSIYIPAGTLHKLSNPGTESLELIEVQTGDYLGEDDIVRVDDEYGRVKEEAKT